MRESNTGTLYTGEFVNKMNAEGLEIRESLPCLYEGLKMAQNGNTEIIGLYFYYKARFTSHKYDDGDNTKNVKTVSYDLIFMDKKVNYFLSSLRKKYSENTGMVQQDSTNGMKFKSVVNTLKVEEEEIHALFNEYLNQFITKHDLGKFEGETSAHSNNLLMKYIKTDFENNAIKALYNKRMGIDRIQIDNKHYTVKNNQEEVFFSDTVCGKDSEDESIGLLDVYDANATKEYHHTETSEYVFEKYKDILTKNQLEKLNQLIAWCNEDGNSVEDLFQKNNINNFSKSVISKVLFPDRKTTSTMKDIDNLFKSMRNRVNKAMSVDSVPTPIKSTVSSTNNFLPDYFSAEEQALFKEYNLEKYIIGVSESKLPSHSMYDKVNVHTREPFITKRDYESVLLGLYSVQELIDMYGISKRELNAKSSKVTTYKMVEPTDEYDMVVTQSEMDRIMESHALGMLERIQKGSIYFNLDTETNMMVANTYQLNPIPLELTDTLYSIAPTKNVEILTTYYNTDVLHVQQKFMKIVNKEDAVEKKKVRYLSPSEINDIRTKRNSK